MEYKRTHHCGELRIQHETQNVIINGWVHNRRNFGSMIFLLIRDRSGFVQAVVTPESSVEVQECAHHLTYEYCVAIQAVVRRRPDDMCNADLATGAIEVVVEHIVVLNRCVELPFMLIDGANVKEDIRLKYRYLDLRRVEMQKMLQMRHQVSFIIRQFLHAQNFYEIETPTLMRSTPEGARDFIVPSRLQKGSFYALPQSPQLYKQMLMISGVERYFQLARCYRDEDARGDRQPEHTQIDIEMSFVDKNDIFTLTENMLYVIFRDVLSYKLPEKFSRLSYYDALNIYGSDKPDIRFDLCLCDCSVFASNSQFSVFTTAIENGHYVKGLRLPGCAEYSRKDIENLEVFATQNGAHGLAWMKVLDNQLTGGIAKFFVDSQQLVIEHMHAVSGDLLLFVADEWKVSCTALGAIRNEMGKRLNLIDYNTFAFLWIENFPLFSWNSDVEKWESEHHLFASPQARYIEHIEKDPATVLGDLYDLVCNGYELASGSIRIHSLELQKRIFDVVGISMEEAQQKFGFFLNALQYGAPPHGGIAPGLDRLLMIMMGKKSIREVIAFPKNTLGASPLDGSPDIIDKNQLDELSLYIAE